MDSQRYLASAEEHAEAGRFDAATAYAQMAIAASMQRSVRATAIYPGDHQPLPADWCGKCHSPGRRVTDKITDCPKCHPRSLRARPCRYCGVLLEERLDSSGSEGSWAWRDEHSSVNCPKAPDPAAPQPLPAQAEQDLNPDGVWQRFLLEWNDHETLREEAVSAEALLATPTLFPYVPRTRLGERPHADHLEAWLGARADQPYGRLQLTEEPLADGSAARTWRLTST